MIKVNKLNGNEVVVNAEMIELIEATPDTLITLTTGKKIIVSNSIDEIIKKVIEYRRQIVNNRII